MIIIDCCISLKMIKNILVVLGVVDMRQLLLREKFEGTREFPFKKKPGLDQGYPTQNPKIPPIFGSLRTLP